MKETVRLSLSKPVGLKKIISCCNTFDRLSVTKNV